MRALVASAAALPQSACRTVALTLGITFGFGCGGSSKPPETPTPAAQGDEDITNGVRRPILPPLELTEDVYEDAVVRVVAGVSCSGTLIAEDLVLTAHHCVSARDGDGNILKEDVDPASVVIELGGDYLPWGEVGVREIVAPTCGYAAGHGDIAILVLDRELLGMPTLDPQIASTPEVGDQVEPTGFGRCALSRDAIRRVRRDGAVITKVTKGRFVADMPVCPGDSGGPVTGPGGPGGARQVVGVISASVMDGVESTPGRSYFTRLDAWPQLFNAAREMADGASAAELPPFRSCSAKD